MFKKFVLMDYDGVVDDFFFIFLFMIMENI